MVSRAILILTAVYFCPQLFMSGHVVAIILGGLMAMVGLVSLFQIVREASILLSYVGRK